MAGEVFRIKAIKPSLLKVKEIRLEMLNELRREGADLVAEFKKTTASWEGAKPDFNPKISLTSRDASVQVGPSGNEEGVNKWGWLNFGTRRRWALMSQDWRSKTAPGRLASGSGSGGVLIAGRGAMQRRGIGVRPGIKARGWSKTIARQNTRRFPNRVTLAIKRAKKF